MTDMQSRLEMLEARAVAHRRLLARLLAASGRATRESVTDWLVSHEVPSDGQEDPGAVLSELDSGLMTEAEEFRAIAALVEQESGQLES
ncbi:hypothetical protein [Marinibacterium profundimaris]|uniref:Uncharacterized protein n=1 Tax=Marinibacterium profundimaris TaxID=1679460 RepID=A0A225NIJ3_9RHOB|nr:hypothetical protein [Marinibacterium profundimaris]OWU68097.1 hypothetical protein ATO3_24675 [Marinibacterium profundimaris]